MTSRATNVTNADGNAEASGGDTKRDRTDSLRTDSSNRTICIGDIHGNLIEFQQLWKALNDHLGAKEMGKASIVFLGDYVDRGPATKGVIEYLVHLKKSRAKDKTHFIIGNHDFGLAAFIGRLPIAGATPSIDLDSTKDPSFSSGFWPHPVEGGMHYQGRRWGGSTVYQAQATFESYGVEYACTPEARAQLLKAMPESHKQFLSELKWVHEERVRWDPGRLICVHAGLRSGVCADLQLRALHARRLAGDHAALYEDNRKARFASMHGRRDVLRLPEDLRGKAVLMSGHHGICKIEGDRIIIDASGGRPRPGHPIQAVIFPERILMGSDGPSKSLRKSSLSKTALPQSAKHLFLRHRPSI